MFFSNPKKEFFKKKIQLAWQQVWEWEFKKKQYMIMKEDMRLEYDKMIEAIPAYEIRIEKLNKGDETPPEWTKETIADEITNATKALEDRKRDVEQIKSQMDGMDQHVAQADANIEGGRAVIDMVKAEIKAL